MHSSDDKKKKFFAWMRVVLFMLCLIAVCSILKFAIMPPSYARVIIHTMNDKDENYDTIVLGASHGRSAINPYKLDEKLSCNSLNVCIPNETIKDSYYLLQEAARTNDIKTVILDIDYQYWYGLKENNYFSTFIYDQLSLSSVKAKYFTDNLLDEDFRVAMTRWAGYSYLIKNAKSNLKTKLTKDYFDYSIDCVDNRDGGGPYLGKGFFYRQKLDEDSGFGEFKAISFDADGVDKETVEIFRKIVKYCKDKNIRLVCATSPITPSMLTCGDYGKVTEYFTSLCEEQDIEYYDFNLIKDDVLDFEDTDYVDYDGHMVGELADRYSRVLGDVISRTQEYYGKESSEVESVVSDLFYASYDEMSKNMNYVQLADMKIEPIKLDNGGYAVNINAILDGGKNVTPECRVVIKSMDTKKILYDSGYSDNMQYHYEFDDEIYIAINVYGRNKGSSEKYEAKSKTKKILLNDETVNKYRTKKKSSN